MKLPCSYGKSLVAFFLANAGGVSFAASDDVSSIVVQASGLLNSIYPVVVLAAGFVVAITLVRILKEWFPDPTYTENLPGGESWFPDLDDADELYPDGDMGADGPEIPAPDSDFHDNGIYPPLGGEPLAYSEEMEDIGALLESDETGFALIPDNGSSVFEVLEPELSKDEQFIKDFEAGVYGDVPGAMDGAEVRFEIRKTIDI